MQEYKKTMNKRGERACTHTHTHTHIYIYIMLWCYKEKRNEKWEKSSWKFFIGEGFSKEKGRKTIPKWKKKISRIFVHEIAKMGRVYI